MKPKRMNKVLTLKKTTVSDLNKNQMGEVKGGYWYTGFDYTCYTWCHCQTNYYHCKTELSYCCIITYD